MKSGDRIVRPYHGRDAILTVRSEPGGGIVFDVVCPFHPNGLVVSCLTLTAAAKAITGRAEISGPEFWRVGIWAGQGTVARWIGGKKKGRGSKC